jgi:hypothetical protein
MGPRSISSLEEYLKTKMLHDPLRRSGGFHKRTLTEIIKKDKYLYE